jgi:hypothetical protein
MRKLPCILALASACSLASSQEIPVPQLKPGSERKASPPDNVPAIVPLQTIDLVVPRGTPIQVALDDELRVSDPGQKVHARVVEPVYAFDKVVIPVGSEALGRITRIEATSKGKRTEAALNADFTPIRKVHVEFTELVLKDGKHIPVNTSVAPGSGEVLQFTSAANNDKKRSIKDTASQKTSEAKQQARQEWDNAMKQLKTPGRMHRIKRYVQSQLPVHPQYIPSGTVYLAALNEPLNFGSEAMSPEVASSIGSALPEGAVVHARLVTPLSSANARKDDPVEAVLSRPLFDQEKLVLPQGSRLKGVVLQAQPARRLKKNGQLRITFRELVPPDGIPEKVVATLEAVEAAKSGNVKLDSEGGAEATNPKTRYLSTGLSVALAAASGGGDSGDRDRLGGGGSNAAGGTGARVAGGAGGFKLVGIALGLAVKSRALGRAMGVYGAGMSVYSNFMTRGREVVFPKDMAMDIGVGKHAGTAPASPPPDKFTADTTGNGGF